MILEIKLYFKKKSSSCVLGHVILPYIALPVAGEIVHRTHKIDLTGMFSCASLRVSVFPLDVSVLVAFLFFLYF